MTDTQERRATVVVDLGFGDSGKGTMTDWLARSQNAHTVVRFNGGSQAGHNVVDPDGRHHTFAQFCSATFAPGVQTHLSRHMLVNPLAMLEEERSLRRVGVTDAFSRMTVHRDALCITPFQRAANRLRELARGAERHGTCGHGIGETASDALRHPELAVRASDYLYQRNLIEKLRRVQEHKRAELAEVVASLRAAGVREAEEECQWLDDPEVCERYAIKAAAFAVRARIVDDAWFVSMLERPGSVVFEGAQGVLLDEMRGFHPHTTWSNCTFGNALGLLKEFGFEGETTKLGVVRGYATRHGEGPFVTEDAELSACIPELHGELGWAGRFKHGWFDAVMARYAVAAAGGIDALAVTCLDRLEKDVTRPWRICNRYRLPHEVSFSGTFRWQHGSGLATGIRLGPLGDLSYQELITDGLKVAEPVYEDFNGYGRWSGSHEFADRIGELVGTRPSILSYGPTADDKRAR